MAVCFVSLQIFWAKIIRKGGNQIMGQHQIPVPKDIPQWPFVSIIVVNHNGVSLLRECFESLAEVDYSKDWFEVILGDNASTDDSVSMTRSDFPWVQVIRFDHNYGFCRTNNVCATKAHGEYLVFLNNDTIVTASWLKELVLGAISEPGVVSCACKMLFPHLKDGHVINSAGGVIFPSGCGFYDGWMDDDSVRYDQPKYTGFGCGAGVLVKRDFFLSTGGFDEYFFYSGEEMDLGYRAWMTGHKVIYNPRAVMYHYMGKTGFRGQGVTPSIEFLVVRNNLYFILKNFQWPLIIEGTLLHGLRVLFKMAYALAHRNIAIAASLVRAQWHIIKDFRRIWKKRAATQKARTVSDGKLREMGIIASSLEVFRRYRDGAKNMKRFFSGSLYDDRDAVKIKRNENGEMIFYRP